MKIFLQKTIENIFHDIYSSWLVILIAIPLVSHLLLLEMAYHLKIILYDTSLVAPFTLVLLVRELLPVLVSVILTGKLAASFSARIATLTITEQIEAYQLLRYPWKRNLAYPKVISFFVTLLFFSVVSFWIALFVQSIFNPFGFSNQKFLRQAWSLIHPRDFLNGFIKILVFGIFSPLTALYKGARARGGSKEVGNAATSTMVTVSVMIIFVDFVIDFCFSLFE